MFLKTMEHYKNLDLADIKYFCDIDMVEKTEQWKDIPDYVGKYKISDLGRVKSLSEIRFNVINNSNSFYKSKIRKASPEGGGYLQLSLNKDKKQKHFKVHKLVAMAFLGHKLCGYKEIIDHKNNIRKDNRLLNLQITTTRHNNSKDTKGTSSLTGVCLDKQNKKWRAQININKKTIFLGLFHSEKEANDYYVIALLNIEKFNGNYKEFRKIIKKVKI